VDPDKKTIAVLGFHGALLMLLGEKTDIIVLNL
jgi:hypothetical protein